MTWAAGITMVTTRVGAIESLLASRSGTKVQSVSVLDSAAPGSSSAAFDPFGAAYQQALMGVDVRPSSAAGSTSPDPATSMLRTASFDPTVATRRPGGFSTGRIAGGATTGQIGGYGDMPVPPELAAYGNGHIPASALEPIGQGGHRLWAPAAEAWKSMVAAAAADGIDLRVTDSYRSYDNQVILAKEKGLYADGGWAAVPGTSNHGWGLAVDADVSDPATLDWVQANGHRFGFVQAAKREPWHWEYRPDQA